MKNAETQHPDPKSIVPARIERSFESFFMCVDFHQLQKAHHALLVNCLFTTPSKVVVDLTDDQRDNLLLLLEFLTDAYEYKWQELLGKNKG